MAEDTFPSIRSETIQFARNCLEDSDEKIRTVIERNKLSSLLVKIDLETETNEEKIEV